MRARNGEGVRGSEAPQKMRELGSDRREREPKAVVSVEGRREGGAQER